MRNTPVPISLTPAQVTFCEKHIPDFKRQGWHIGVAGNAGSDRNFIRIASVSDTTFSRILVVWDSHDQDWQRFQTINSDISRFLPLLPVIYAQDETHGLLLVEDCGYYTLKEYCLNNNDPAVLEDIYKKVLHALIHWQAVDTQKTEHLSSRVLDRTVFLWETDYFAVNCVQDYCGLDSMLTGKWEEERNRLADAAAALPLVCLHRDFQSENIIIQDGGTIKFVDYQGARLGPAEYDLASLLFDPYMFSFLNDSLRYSFLDYYIGHSRVSVSYDTFRIAAMQRLMQALGAYGRLSLHKGKDHYRQYVSPALTLLYGVAQKVHDFPNITRIAQECLNRIQQLPRFA